MADVSSPAGLLALGLADRFAGSVLRVTRDLCLPARLMGWTPAILNVEGVCRRWESAKIRFASPKNLHTRNGTLPGTVPIDSCIIAPIIIEVLMYYR